MSQPTLSQMAEAQQRTALGTFVAGDPRRRFEAYIKRGDNCWLWLGPLYTTGYGSFWYRRRANPMNVYKVPTLSRSYAKNAGRGSCFAMDHGPR